MKLVDYYQKKLKDLKDQNLYRQTQEINAFDAINVVKNYHQNLVQEKLPSKNLTQNSQNLAEKLSQKSSKKPREKLLKKLLEKLPKKLSQKLQNNSQEKPQIAKKLISFASNDYLDLSANKLVKKSAILAIKKYGVGARSSRYISGNNQLYHQLEKALARWKNCDDSLIFSSGYLAGIGIIPALVGKGDLIIADKLIHSCLLDGIKLSQAKLIRFKHNDFEDCQKILQQNRQNFQKCLIITETIFSMDGDVGIVVELKNLASEFSCLLLTDDAHGLGLKLFDQEISSPNHLQMGTFSKAFGSLGGYVCGDKILIDYLRNFAKSQIYSTALPPAILASCATSLKIISQKKLGQKALANAQYFCQLMNLEQPSSAIIVIIVENNEKLLAIVKNVEQQGFLISGIRKPTVATPRLRITFNSSHQKKDIKKLVDILKKII
jgi:8-amino-7-oxononanoate synthase